MPPCPSGQCGYASITEYDETLSGQNRSCPGSPRSRRRDGGCGEEADMEAPWDCAYAYSATAQGRLPLHTAVTHPAAVGWCFGVSQVSWSLTPVAGQHIGPRQIDDLADAQSACIGNLNQNAIALRASDAHEECDSAGLMSRLARLAPRLPASLWTLMRTPALNGMYPRSCP
jgi:hypothetical protein